MSLSLLFFITTEINDIGSALSKLTEPATTVPISKMSVANMVHSARKHIRRHRRIDESPLNTDVLNSVLLVITKNLLSDWAQWSNYVCI